MKLEELVPFVKAELKANKLWRDEYDDWETFAAGHDGPDRQEHLRQRIAVEGPLEIGSPEWLVYTIDVIRQRFFTLKDFSAQGRAYFSEDFDFEPGAVAKNLTKFPDLRQWMPELADRFEAEFSVESPDNSQGLLPFTEDRIEALVKAFTEEKGTKLGVIMNGARTLLTGVAVGPSMLSVFEVIGLERTIMRLKSQVAWSVEA
jgi:glutamyl-tRNA synthetase